MSDEIPTAGSALTDGTDAAETATDETGGMSITDGLMSTEPDIRVAEAQETTGGGKAVSHAYIGVRKFVAGLTGMATGAGMPAVGNFALAGFHVISEESADTDRDDGGDDAELVEAEFQGETFTPGEDFG